MRKILWHNTFTEAIDKTVPFSRALTLARFTLAVKHRNEKLSRHWQFDSPVNCLLSLKQNST
ncbi:hypothetical protein [Bacteroides ovatus]|uniref:hypothetical protein n=1 Tax=Bacteroides ovatus TaxID=28116 RepID=UPI00321BBD81